MNLGVLLFWTVSIWLVEICVVSTSSNEYTDASAWTSFTLKNNQNSNNNNNKPVFSASRSKIGGSGRRKPNRTVKASINCPAECVCQGLSVDCSHRDLKQVPKNIPSNAIRLDLQGNQLNKIKIEELSYLKNLKVLHIHENQIEFIERGAFDSLQNLERLRLNNNNLTFLPADLFTSLRSLRRLDLSFNMIKSVGRDIFSKLYNLNNLQLDHNKLTCVEKEAFAQLNKLDILTLNDNNLSELTSFLLSTNTKELKTLRLANNKLECNCKILWLTKFFMKHVHLAHEAKCFMRNKNSFREIISLKEDEFNCNSEENDDIETSCSTEFNCPYSCVCENNIVDCKEKFLTEIPKDIPESTVELHLKKNLITEIPSGAFANLKKLRLLDLSNNQISKLHGDSFRGLDSLNTLILFRNEINNLPSKMFAEIPSLQFLQLSHNNLVDLNENFFTGCRNLTILLLNANKLTCLRRDTFSGLVNLNLLSLFDNQLKSLPSGIFDPFQSVQTIHLGRNPLICDCKLKWLNDYFRSRPVERSGIQCSTPKRLAKKSIGSIPNYKFKCNTSSPHDYYLEEFCVSFNECPKDCSCHGSTVDCRGLGLLEIPPYIPPYTTDLYLQNNEIKSVKANGVFQNLKHLKKLDLRNNKIESIEEKAFDGADSLSDLFLNENQLRRIRPNMFYGLRNLKTLLIRANKLVSIQNNTFSGLDSLRLLSLYDNKIKCIQEGSFSNLKSLSTLNLMSNPFICDCNLKWIKNWLKESNLAIGNPKCTLPNSLKDRSLSKLDVAEFICSDDSEHKTDECSALSVPANHVDTDNLKSVCPKGCTCSKSIVRCSFAKFKQVPVDIPSSVKELYLDSNEISEIPSFINQLVNLEKLDLSSNRLEMIPSRVFDNLKKLDTLILSFNSIECLFADSFAGLSKLRLLSLYANRLVTIPENSFAELTTLSHIGLGLNPLHCDCKLAWLSSWIKTDYVEPGIARCLGPSNLANKLILTASTQLFICTNETKLDEPISRCSSCYKNSCKHNSTCLAKSTSTYECKCGTGYYGEWCQHKIDACFGQPCKNEGVCKPIEDDKYECQCKPGWEGNNCQTDMNECASAPCLNGGACVNKLGSFECKCLSGYSGSNCENKVDWCMTLESNPCQNSGKCSKINDNQYKCDCPIGFSGGNCEVNEDDCQNHKCQFGTCVDGFGNYTCLCKEGFSGPFCEIMNPIALALQQQQQSSDKPIVQHQKQESLTQQLIGCTVNDCSNGGICYRTSLGNKIDPITKCKCQLGYTGSKCEILNMVNYKHDDSYLELESPELDKKFNLTFTIVTEAEDGVLFYHGSKAKKHLGVELFKGRIRVSYDIGNTQASTVFSYAKLNDRKQHQIQMLIHGANITIKLVDLDEERVLTNQAGLFSHLNVGDEPLYVGGVPNSIRERITKQLSHVKNASSFAGCLHNLYINSELKNLQQVEYSHKVVPGCLYSEACYESNNKCLNGGICKSEFSLNRDFSCECIAQAGQEYTGSLCEIKVEKQAIALPLMSVDSKPDTRLKNHPIVRKESSCTETIVKDFYIDQNSGCRTRRKFKMIKCRGDCSESRKQQPGVQFHSFRSLNDKQPFGYLIGSNNRKHTSLISARSMPQCCAPSKTRVKSVKLFCDDGRMIQSNITLIKQCACSDNNKCS